jgi:branched-chain amino acid transport system ATP-binding protein
VDEEALLRTIDLTKAFGGLIAVNRATVSLTRGEIRALIGPNGAGKTTFFNLLTGHLKPDSGRIQFKGEDLTGLPPYRIWRRGMSRTFQIPAIFGSKTVFENVQMAVLAHRRETMRMFVPVGRRCEQEVKELLEMVELSDKADNVSGVLSYGDLKKLELAIALANDPELLLLDEPTAGMAPTERGMLMKLIEEIALQRGFTVLFTEHDMDVVFSIARKITVMHQGSIITEGSPHEVRENPEIQRIYLGEEA